MYSKSDARCTVELMQINSRKLKKTSDIGRHQTSDVSHIDEQDRVGFCEVSPTWKQSLQQQS